MSSLPPAGSNGGQRPYFRYRNLLSLLFSLSVLLGAIWLLAVPTFAAVTANALDGQPGGDQAADRVETAGGQTWYMEAPLALGPGGSVPAEKLDPKASDGPQAPLAPGLLASFDGLNITTGGGFIPPDPIAAAGPNHVVSVVNVSIQWRTKTGASATSQSLSTFFAPVTPTTATFDPKVIYDQFAGRFVVVTLERVNASPNNNPDPGNISRILVAVSNSSDPNGAWSFQAINAKTVIGPDEYWADYPGLAIDEEAVYITNNMFVFPPSSPPGGSFGGSRLWVLDKVNPTGGLYGGGTSAVTVHDPSALASVGFDYFTIQPAHIFGNAPVGVGTWLVSYSALTNGTTEFVGMIRIDNPLTAITFTNQFVSLGDLEANAPAFGPVIPSPIPDAPQSGPFSDIETNDRRALHAVWRNNSLWTTFEIVPPAGPDNGQVTAHWVEVDTSVLAVPVLADQGNAGAEDIATGTFTYFPSIAVDQCGNMGLGFAASAPTTFAGAYYTVRYASDAPGTTQSTGTLATGLASYQLTDSIGRNRWGDYTGTALDPANEATFWLFNEYAGTPSSRWNTRYGSLPSGIDFGDLPSLYSATLFADDGARHCIGDPLLGSIVDPDDDGAETAASDGDDSGDGNDDEDGVSVTGNWSSGTGSVDVDVTGGRGCVSGWVDFSQDGDFNDVNEQVINNQPVNTGTTGFNFPVPVSVSGQTFNGRFRLVDDADNDGSCADQAAVGQTGLVASGEVEDYQWAFATVVNPPTSVVASGPVTGTINTSYSFTATVAPPTTTLPLTYTWQATDQTTVVSVTSSLTESVSFSWPTTGPKTITVTAANNAGSVADTHVITISVPVVVTPTSVLINGPTTGTINAAYSFTATVSPISTTLPLTYTWQATDQTPVVNVASSLNDTVMFNWGLAGSKTITVTAANSAGQVVDTHTIAITIVPPGSVTISGPTAGLTNTSYDFGAAVAPVSTTLPLTYTWQATGQAPIVVTASSLTDTVSFTWTLTGTKTITVTAANSGGSATDTHLVTISAPVIVAPTSVLISGPVTGTVNTAYGFTAAVSPISTTTPLTYTWEASDSSTVVNVSSNVTDTVILNWEMSGTKFITVTAANSAGLVVDTHSIVISAPVTVAPAGVTISGPVTGTAGTSYDFTATVTPLSTSLPLTYTWQATDQTMVVAATSSLTDTVSFTWLTPGSKTVTVTAANGAGMVMDSHIIVIDVKLHLPIVFKN